MTIRKYLGCFVYFCIPILIIISKITFILICHTWLNKTKIWSSLNLKLAISEEPYNLKVQKFGTNYSLAVLLKCRQKKLSFFIKLRFEKGDFCIGPINFKCPYLLNHRFYESQSLVLLFSNQYKSNVFNKFCKFKTSTVSSTFRWQ